jgi:SPP1 family predicted phage head-tail adaptor
MQGWPQIDPGQMVHQVTILKQQQSSDISGTTTIWVPFVSTWAQIDPVRGTDVLRSGQATTQLFLTIKIRWQAGVLPSMRVQSLNGTYVIQAIENPGERNVILVLTCLGLGANQ